jgi:hypothetical protein
VVIREVVSKVEARFEQYQTQGRRSPTGQGHKRSRATGLCVYVRPGLGLSCLVTEDFLGWGRIVAAGYSDCNGFAGAQGRSAQILPLHSVRHQVD